MAHIMGLGNQSESWKIIILSQKFTNVLCMCSVLKGHRYITLMLTLLFFVFDTL